MPDDEKYVRGNERDVRNVILLLVKAISRTRRNLMAANMAIQATSNMPPDERKALTTGRIQAELRNIEQQLERQPDPAIVRIVNVLEGDGDFLESLRVFASKLHW
ncbi:MAG TPA: hypothetical protein VNU74_09080 [Terriglobales bacterium]|jgi:hypothetical protein|nr:hypothetical protein [Terriglobales bacterium]